MRLFSSRLLPSSQAYETEHSTPDVCPTAVDGRDTDVCAPWMQRVQAWTQAAAPLVDLTDLQTQPIWQHRDETSGGMPAQAMAQLDCLDMPRVLAWFERPLPYTIGTLHRGESPKEGFVSRLRQTVVPTMPAAPKRHLWQRLSFAREPALPSAADAFAIAGLAHGHVALCLDILVPPTAPEAPAWPALLGAPAIGILPPAPTMRALLWTLSLRGAAGGAADAGSQAYEPALVSLLEYVFEAVMLAPKAPQVIGGSPSEATRKTLADRTTHARAPVDGWAQACLMFDFETEQAPHARRAQAVIVHGFRKATAAWLGARLPQRQRLGRSAEQLGRTVDSLWAAFVGGVFAPTSTRGLCSDHLGHQTWTAKVHDRFRAYCARRAPFRNAEQVEGFVAKRLADDIITPLQRGEMAPRRLFSAQILRHAQDIRRFGRSGTIDGVGPETQGKLLAQQLEAAAAPEG